MGKIPSVEFGEIKKDISEISKFIKILQTGKQIWAPGAVVVLNSEAEFKKTEQWENPMVELIWYPDCFQEGKGFGRTNWKIKETVLIIEIILIFQSNNGNMTAWFQHKLFLFLLKR